MLTVPSSYLSASASAEDSASDELFISQTQRVTKDALGKLIQAINSRDYKTGSECTETLYSEINAVFPSGANIDPSIRSYLHDIRHHLTLLTDSFTEQPSIELENIQTAGFEFLSILIPKIFQNTSSHFSLKKISTIVGNTIHLSAYYAKQNAVAFVYKPSAQLEKFIVTDENTALAIRRVLFNLLHNAVHYTSNQSETRQVKLHITIADSIDSRLSYAQFIITDSGVGISSDDFKKLFTQGFQGSKEKVFTGSGTGLTTCKKLIEEIKGEICCISFGENSGSLFWFTAPVLLDEPPVAATSSIIERKNIRSSNMKVLIVDDARSARRVLANAMKNCGIGILEKNIDEAEDGEKALEKNIDEYDLILMDMELGQKKNEWVTSYAGNSCEKYKATCYFFYLW